MEVLLPPVEGLPWRVLGYETDDHEVTAVAWASDDLADWTRTELPGPDGHAEVVQAAAHQPGRDIAVGWDEQRRDLTWISDDGIEWRIAEQGSAPIEAIAVGPAGVLGIVGTWDAAGDTVTGFDIWKLLEDH